MYPDLLVHIFDQLVQVLVPGVGILILEVTAHCHHDVVRVEVLGLQSDCKKSEDISKWQNQKAKGLKLQGEEICKF